MMNVIFLEKLDVEVSVIKNSVEGLVNLLIESCRYKVYNIDFIILLVLLLIYAIPFDKYVIFSVKF